MAASMPVTSGQRRAAANLITILLPHFAAESSSRAFASTLSAALCRNVRAVGVGGRGLLKPCAWERVGVVVGCRLPWRIPIHGEGRQPCRLTGEYGSLRPRRLCPTPEMVASRTFYGRLQLLGSMATVLTTPPSGGLLT